MTRFTRRWVCLALFAFAATASAQRLGLRETDETPNAETLKRLAQQLGAGNNQLPQNIDPELMKLAQQYLEKNPDILKDPSFQKQVQEWQQQAKQNPAAFEQMMKGQNPNLSQEQIDNLKKQFQQSNPNGFAPPPSIGPQPPRPDPAALDPKPPTQPPIGQPGNPNPQQQNPGPQNQWPPNGQNQNGQNQANPFQSAEQKAQAKQEFHQVVGLWENSFGDIDNTPALKQSLVDMFSGDGKTPWDGQGNPNGNNPLGGSGGNKPGGQKPWWDSGNGSNGGSNNGFVNWLKNTGSSPPTWWKSMTNWNNTTPPPNMGSGWKPPQPSGGFGGGGGGFSGGDIGGVATPVVIVVVLIVAAVAAFVLWRYWPQIQAKLMNQPKPLPGLGPWTIDPRDVTDRETLVRAFEYLSLLICGDSARVWNHQTIADAFRENVPGAAPFADPLARLYALARYSPANEAISPADIAEARGYLCRLAEVPA